MQRTPPIADKVEKGQPARSETEQESDSGKVTRRKKVKQSTETDLDAALTFKLTSFKHDITEHMTKLFSGFQEKQDMKLSTLLTDMGELKKEVMELKKFNTDIEQRVSTLSAQYEMSLQNNIEVTKHLEILEQQHLKDAERITLLEDKLEDLQRSSRKTSIEIKNVPKQTGEDREVLMKMVLQLGKSIDCNVNSTCVRDIYRVRETKNGLKNTPIIVEFSSTLAKTEILKKSKSYNVRNKEKLRAKNLGLTKNEETSIFVSEHLTVKASRLYFLARDLAKSKGYKFCWSSYGRIYVRRNENSPIILIRSEIQVNNLLQAA